jgi:hypothetical protein
VTLLVMVARLMRPTYLKLDKEILPIRNNCVATAYHRRQLFYRSPD